MTGNIMFPEKHPIMQNSFLHMKSKWISFKRILMLYCHFRLRSGIFHSWIPDHTGMTAIFPLPVLSILHHISEDR